MVAREQFAWVWLLTMLVTYPAYFTAVIAMGETTFWTQIIMFSATAIVQIAIIAVASTVIALRKRNEMDWDERDRAIDHRATGAAYTALIIGIIVVGCVMPFSHSGWDIFHAAVFAIALAEIIRHALIIAKYRGGLKEGAQARRGWHG